MQQVSGSGGSETDEEILARVRLAASWKTALANEFTSTYMRNLRDFLMRCQSEGKVVYPPFSQIFAAFDRCSLQDVKVVIVGQDPYIQAGQAHGLCFSVPRGVQPPPSLLNIFKEINADLGEQSAQEISERKQLGFNKGCLNSWAEQGVLLLNSVLTVYASRSGSHQGEGWDRFTDKVIEILNHEREHLVFLLWGNYAKRKGAQVDPSKHLILTAAHPSPLSANSGFFGCRHFSKTNQYLIEHDKSPIDWFNVT